MSTQINESDAVLGTRCNLIPPLNMISLMGNDLLPVCEAHNLYRHGTGSSIVELVFVFHDQRARTSPAVIELPTRKYAY